MEIHSRLPDVGTSIFAVMSKMAQEHGAINLSQGFPDFKVSEKLIELVHQQMKDGYNQYAPMPGVPSLRQTIANVIFQSYKHKVDPDTDITITAGGTEAIFATITGLVSPGDEVILFDPSYDCYDPAIRLNGGIPVPINILPPDFAIDWDMVKSKITPQTRMIMINTPQNPSGAILTENDLKTLEGIVNDHDILVLSDEVYERIIFDELAHQSVMRFPGLAANSIAVFSFGKTFHATGWKIGYTVAPAAITKEIRKAHQFITFSVNTPVQLALAEYMQQPSHYLELSKFYQQKRDFFLDQIKDSSFEPMICHGSYFQLLSYKRISSKPDMEMAEWLTKEHKLASIPVSVFYKDRTDNQLLRFCFAKGEDTLKEAGKILNRF
ncbi:MAG: aminotransferase class I/II-fold pyridoxal phosphate-dependent enzyme [Cyclobacteriaceae bacterium]|nr:aminotransferase class I/II-fold pyridoxal phosphate-dependent enzyme [Cyclobacteriaceae bacterium]